MSFAPDYSVEYAAASVSQWSRSSDQGSVSGLPSMGRSVRPFNCTVAYAVPDGAEEMSISRFAPSGVIF